MAVHYGNPFVTKLRQAGIGLARTLMCKHAAAAAAAVVAAAAVAAEALSEAVVLDWHASVSQERQEANAKLAESVAAHCGNDVDGEIILSAVTVWQHKSASSALPTVATAVAVAVSERCVLSRPTGFEPTNGVERFVYY